MNVNFENLIKSYHESNIYIIVSTHKSLLPLFFCFPLFLYLFNTFQRSVFVLV